MEANIYDESVIKKEARMMQCPSIPRTLGKMLLREVGELVPLDDDPLREGDNATCAVFRRVRTPSVRGARICSRFKILHGKRNQG